MSTTRRGFIGGAAAVGAGTLLASTPALAAGAEVSPEAHGVAGHLARACAPQIRAIRHHPWIRGAASDGLKDIQIGSWATQDLLWGTEIGPVYTTGFAGAPPPALAALKWLEGNSASETAYLERTSKDFRNAPGAHRIWPGYLGYGAYGALTGTRESGQAAPHVRSLTVVWVAEYAYHQAWKTVLDARPRQAWARFGAHNWGGSPFAGMVANLSAGLNDAVAAGNVPLHTVEEIARQTFLWEFRAWTDAWECKGWKL
jgi:hypothetical protein